VALRVALDTNRYVDLCRDVAGIPELLESAAAIYLPFVVSPSYERGSRWDREDGRTSRFCDAS
jgi:hypothetical protein